MTLTDRFAAAGAHAPLSTCAPDAGRELSEVLRRVSSFEDLPGKWQAALLQAEAAAAGAGPAPARSCCGHHAVA